MKRIKKILFGLILTFLISIKANALTLSKTDATIGIGYSITIEALNNDGSVASNVNWISGNTGVATVENGKVIGISEGNTIITASLNGNIATCKINVIKNYIAITSIELTTKSLSLLLGDTKQIVYELKPSNATNKVATFTSENTNIATVDSNGNVKGIGAGTTNIIISTESYTKKVSVTVTSNISLKSISLDKSLEIDELSEKTLTVTYNPTNATNKKVTWKSSDETIATVDANGKVIAKKAGNVTITATSSDGGYTASCKVVVKEISKKVTAIKLDKEELKLEKGNETTLKVIFTPTYAENIKITWKSSDSKIASVDENGKVVALKAGTATITATSDDGGYEATCKVTIPSVPIEKISFAKETSTVYIGNKLTLETVSTPEDSIIENPIWKSSDEEIATVSEEGIVTGIATGTVTITVSNQDGTITASTEVNVIEAPAEPLSISIEGYELNFTPNTMQYTLKIKNEKSLNITTNYEDNITVTGNDNLKDGSLITITFKQKNKTKKEYVIIIEKSKNYTIYFIGIVSIILLINIIRIMLKNKNKRKY